MTSESIQRGCYKKDLNSLYCDAAKDNCHVCTTFNCNSKVYRGIECQKCDSRIDDNCQESPTLKAYVYCISDQENEMLNCVLLEQGTSDSS